MEEKRTELVLTYLCRNENEAKRLCNVIGDRLRGLDDYIESNIVLNLDGDTVRLYVTEDCSDMSKVAALGWDITRILDNPTDDNKE